MDSALRFPLTVLWLIVADEHSSPLRLSALCLLDTPFVVSSRSNQLTLASEHHPSLLPNSRAVKSRHKSYSEAEGAEK